MGKFVVFTRRSIRKQTVTETHQTGVNSIRLRCLLMQAAVERLTRVRQAISRDHSSHVIYRITTDYEAMYAYKCREHEQRLHLCEHNVNKLLLVSCVMSVYFVASSDLLFLLMDDDLLSLVGLIVGHPQCVETDRCMCPSTLYLYLLVKCKLQLRHLMTSLAAVLTLVSSTYRHPSVKSIFDRLILAFVYRKVRRT